MKKYFERFEPLFVALGALVFTYVGLFPGLTSANTFVNVICTAGLVGLAIFLYVYYEDYFTSKKED